MKTTWGHVDSKMLICTLNIFDMKICVLIELQHPCTNLISLGEGLEGEGVLVLLIALILSTSMFCFCLFPFRHSLFANGWSLVGITQSPRNWCFLCCLNQAVPKVVYIWLPMERSLSSVISHLQSSYGLTSMELAMRDPLSVACFMIL